MHQVLERFRSADKALRRFFLFGQHAPDSTTGSKAAPKRPHSKRSARYEALGSARQRLECGRFSAVFPTSFLAPARLVVILIPFRNEIRCHRERAPPLPIPLLHSERRRGCPQGGRGGSHRRNNQFIIGNWYQMRPNVRPLHRETGREFLFVPAASILTPPAVSVCATRSPARRRGRFLGWSVRQTVCPGVADQSEVLGFGFRVGSW